MLPSIGPSSVLALCWFWCAAIAPQVGNAQDSTAAVSGEIRDEQGHSLWEASIYAPALRRDTRSDAQGRFELRDLLPGSVRIRVRYIGFEALDTTLVLRPGERGRLVAVLHEPRWVARAAKADSERVAAGGVDSVARGLVATDTSAALTYERFGTELLRGAVRSARPDLSRVLSPLSAGQALALLLAAARDSTTILMGRGLRLENLTAESLAVRSRRFNESVRARRDVILKVANAVWVDTSATLRPEFAGAARTLYAAVVRELPLSGQEVVATLNHWADSVTAGLIPEIRRDPFDPATEVVLTNAVYFKGLWLDAFEDSLTRDRAFTSASGERGAVPTMERTGPLAYRHGRGYQALRIPYRCRLSAMYVVLPDSGLSAAALLDSLVAGGWPLPDPRRDVRDVNLRLPRLHITQETDLRPPLSALGLDIMFDSGRADFGGLVVERPDRPPPCPPLSSGLHSDTCTRHRVSSAQQSVYLDVDEQGTQAAAVTTIALEIVITATPAPVPFYVDRPFLFALRDERTGTFLFMGYVASPNR